MRHVRAAEGLSLLVFAWLVILAWRRSALGRARQVRITAIGAGAIALAVFASQALPRIVPPTVTSIARDWVPLLLLTLFYWQAGGFVTGADATFEGRLLKLDRRLIAPLLAWCARHPAAGVWFLTYAELAYLSYYGAMPLAIAVLYLTGCARSVDHFWTVVLLAAYGSCAVLPFIQTRPPRAIDPEWSAPPFSGRVRAFNLRILRSGSIQANTFPSAHVAIATACALGLLHVGPVWIGFAFLWMAASIALGAAAGRYHYTADAILGALTGAAAFVLGAAWNAAN
ncbi:MAG: phosphatase PAP2 family protein [Acidobacteria bacterium]|nr:phosphatase PAP2 family protein [Acidobacteriota bacterium]